MSVSRTASVTMQREPDGQGLQAQVERKYCIIIRAVGNSLM